jgi:hypothetical protein
MPVIVGIARTASTGLAPLARMERYLVDRDLPVRRILASVTVTAIIPTDAPLAPIEIAIPLWKRRHETHRRHVSKVQAAEVVAPNRSSFISLFRHPFGRFGHS